MSYTFQGYRRANGKFGARNLVAVIPSVIFSESMLTYLGIVAISDPVRQDVPAAVQSCINAGIDVKIVTGDTPGTAREIARQIGTWNPDKDTDRNIITGPAFEALTDEEALSRPSYSVRKRFSVLDLVYSSPNLKTPFPTG